MRALLQEKRLNAITSLHHGRGTCVVSKIVGYLHVDLHAIGFVESVLLTWSLQEEGAQEASPMLVCNNLWTE